MRPDSGKLMLMDNNVLACDFGVKQLAGLAGSGYQIDLNQGMDARLVTPEVADLLARLDWIRFIRFSCDQYSQIGPVVRAAELLQSRGKRPYCLFICLLVTRDRDIADASRRVEALKRLRGINLYAQAERNEQMGVFPGKAQFDFARYVYSGLYRRETWDEFRRRWNLPEE